jgi:hypothetical protein
MRPDWILDAKQHTQPHAQVLEQTCQYENSLKSMHPLLTGVASMSKE